MMTIQSAYTAMQSGSLVRNENFAAGVFCQMESDGSIYDPELGYISVTEFFDEYKYFTNGWSIYE